MWPAAVPRRSSRAAVVAEVTTEDFVVLVTGCAYAARKRKWAPCDDERYAGVLEAFTVAPDEPEERAALYARLQLMTPASAASIFLMRCCLI